MNVFDFWISDSIATLLIAYLAGWFVGTILWLLRFIMLELPRAGAIEKR